MMILKQISEASPELTPAQLYLNQTLIPSLLGAGAFAIIIISCLVINLNNYFKLNRFNIKDREEIQIFNVFKSAKALWEIFFVNLVFSAPALIICLNIWFNWQAAPPIVFSTIWQGWSGIVLATLAITLVLTFTISAFWLISALARQLIFETDWNVQNWAQRWWKKRLVKRYHNADFIPHDFNSYLTYLISYSPNWDQFWTYFWMTIIVDQDVLKLVSHLRFNQSCQLVSDIQTYQPLIYQLMIQKLDLKLAIDQSAQAHYQLKYETIINAYQQLSHSEQQLITSVLTTAISNCDFNDAKQAIIQHWLTAYQKLDRPSQQLIVWHQLFTSKIDRFKLYQQLASSQPYQAYFEQLINWIKTTITDWLQYLTIKQDGFQTTIIFQIPNYWYQMQFNYHWLTNPVFKNRFQKHEPFAVDEHYQWYLLKPLTQWLKLNQKLVLAWKQNQYQRADLEAHFYHLLTNQLQTHIKLNFADIINHLRIDYQINDKPFAINYYFDRRRFFKDLNQKRLIVKINLDQNDFLTPANWNSLFNNITNQIKTYLDHLKSWQVWLDHQHYPSCLD